MADMRTNQQVIVKQPDEKELSDLRVKSWPIWTKEPSTFDWFYDEPETCYFLEGEVTVATDAGDVSIKKGDLVTFSQGLQCVWKVKQAVRKHYKFG